jgi:hypothetical protein
MNEIKRRGFLRNLVRIFLAMQLLPALAMAQDQSDWSDWTMGARYAVGLYVFHPSFDTQIRKDSSDGTPGTPLNFEQNLGMSDTETLPGLMFTWRTAKKHSLLLAYYELDRSGSAVTGTVIRFGDKEFEVNLPISSFMDMDVATAAYSYSLLFDERREISINAGLALMDIDFRIIGNGSSGVIQANTSLTAPLPTIGLTGGYAFTDKLYLRGSVGYFSFDLAFSDESGLRGDIATAKIGVFHNTFDRVQFGLAYHYFDIDTAWGDASGFNSLQYNYRGPALSITATF